MSHLGLLVVFAFFVALVFGVLAHDAPREQAAFGLRVFGGFVLAGLVFGWLLFPLPF